MNKNRFIKALFLTFAVTTTAFVSSVSAQKYKTAADTAKLNKEYSELTTDVAELNAKLAKDQGKTADYQSKVSSTQQDALSAATASKDQAATMNHIECAHINFRYV
ncbi:MAG: hypothetical protein EOP45_15575 [Sphingobacteriaceae bacterium]|nr:MAG: hypothetical protein EOP45_15575 [Sphingobacteriaceae bacterium]